MRTHFIAIGGAAMHNLALALHNKGYKVTGSDDAIFEPSKSRLEKRGLLPNEMGWFPEKIKAYRLNAALSGLQLSTIKYILVSGNQYRLQNYNSLWP